MPREKPPQPHPAEPTVVRLLWQAFHEIGNAPKEPARLVVRVRWGEGEIDFETLLDPSKEPPNHSPS